VLVGELDQGRDQRGVGPDLTKRGLVQARWTRWSGLVQVRGPKRAARARAGPRKWASHSREWIDVHRRGLTCTSDQRTVGPGRAGLTVQSGPGRAGPTDGLGPCRAPPTVRRASMDAAAAWSSRPLWPAENRFGLGPE
jgi:hypothetical protein